jgi:hypothetical protein
MAVGWRRLFSGATFFCHISNLSSDETAAALVFLFRENEAYKFQ